MRKSKMKKWLTVGGGIIAVLVVVGYFGWNFAMNYFISSMVANGLGNAGKNQTQAQVTKEKSMTPDGIQPTGTAQEKQTISSGQEKAGNGIENGKQQIQTPSEPASNSSSKGEATNVSSNSKSELPKNPQSTTTQPPAAKPSTETKETEPAQPDQQPPAQQKYDGNISPEEAKKAEDSITVKEKAELTSILLKKLSPSDISLFMKMASNGMTTDEKKEAKKVFLQKLTEDEYNELIKIAAKYGLSSGRDYKTTQEDYKQPVTNSSN